MFIENLVGLCNEKNDDFSDIHRVKYNFLNVFLMKIKLLKATFAENYGKNYIVKLIKTIKGIPVSSVREYIIDILLAFVESFPAESQLWYQEALTPV